jgi:hypothetical protein
MFGMNWPWYITRCILESLNSQSHGLETAINGHVYNNMGVLRAITFHSTEVLHFVTHSPQILVGVLSISLSDEFRRQKKKSTESSTSILLDVFKACPTTIEGIQEAIADGVAIFVEVGAHKRPSKK